MSTSPLVSILIPFYNCKYIVHAIASALNQTYPHIEVIVINDGSDQYTELVTPYLPRITYLEKENNGVASAINLGMKRAKGDYFVWLSSDDFIYPNKVEEQLNFMQEKKAKFSFTNFNTMNRDNQMIKFNAGLHFNSEVELLNLLQNYNPINGCTIMMAREVVEAIGNFNENLRYAQDYEYWLRVAGKFHLHYLPKALTNYRIHNDMGTIRHKKEITEEFHHVRDQYREVTGKIIKYREQSNTLYGF